MDWTLELTNRAGDSSHSKIVNVSETGILFMSPHPFRSNDMLGMVIVVRTTCQIRCVARVVRELPGSSRFATYAAEFVRFADDGQRVLRETLAEAIKRLPAEALPESPKRPAPKPAVASPPPSQPDPLPRSNNSGPVVIRR